MFSQRTLINFIQEVMNAIKGIQSQVDVYPSNRITILVAALAIFIQFVYERMKRIKQSSKDESVRQNTKKISQDLYRKTKEDIRKIFIWAAFILYYLFRSFLRKNIMYIKEKSRHFESLTKEIENKTIEENENSQANKT